MDASQNVDELDSGEGIDVSAPPAALGTVQTVEGSSKAGNGAKKGKRGAGGDEDGEEGGDKKRRNRKPVTCAQCRRRKLKCDRGYPCGACRDRQEGHLCEWEGAIRLPQPHLTRDAEAQELRQQLDRFENILSALTSNPSAVAAASQGGAAAGPSGSTEGVHPTGVAEKGAAEALSLLAANTANSTSPKIANSQHRAQLLAQVQSVGHLVSLLPPKKELDILVTRFLSSEMNFLPVVHIPTFQKRLAAFQQTTATEDPFFLAFLFSIVSYEMGWQITDPTLSKVAGVEKESAMKRFSEASSEALRMAGYMEAPNLDVVRTLIVLYQCASQQLDPRSAYFLTQAIQVAQTLGLHRDCAAAGLKDPIETQERRRLWYILVASDWLDQSGRMSTVSANEFDATEPASAYDTDITETGVVVRPFPTFTPALYHTLLNQLGNYNQLISHSFFAVKPREPITWGKIGDSNAGLDRLKGNLPPLTWKDGLVEPLTEDNPSSDRFRVLAHSTLLKIAIRVNRPFLTRALSDTRFADARERTLTAARELLGIWLAYPDHHSVSRQWQLAYHALNAVCIIAVDLYQDPSGSHSEKNRSLIASVSTKLNEREHKSKISQAVLRVVGTLVRLLPTEHTISRTPATPLEPTTSFSISSLPVPMSIDPFVYISTTETIEDGEEDDRNPELVAIWHELVASYPSMYGVPDQAEWRELTKAPEERWKDGIDLVSTTDETE